MNIYSIFIIVIVTIIVFTFIGSLTLFSYSVMCKMSFYLSQLVVFCNPPLGMFKIYYKWCQTQPMQGPYPITVHRPLKQHLKTSIHLCNFCPAFIILQFGLTHIYPKVAVSVVSFDAPYSCYVMDAWGGIVVTDLLIKHLKTHTHAHTHT